MSALSLSNSFAASMVAMNMSAAIGPSGNRRALVIKGGRDNALGK